MDIKVIVATHKAYWMPTDEMYLPVQAGRARTEALPYQGDHTGDSISEKNPNYCELTCLYWAWKQLKADAIGLVHYRRHFRGRFAFSKRKQILTQAQAEALLAKAPIILPKKRNYFIESNYQQYVHAHHEADLIVTRAVLAEKYPAYLQAYDRVMARTSGYRFNMCIMRRDLMDAYCSWLFEVLFEVERRLDIRAYSRYDARVFGFISERLLDVWIEHHQPRVCTLPCVNLESQKWGRKIWHFLLRKLTKGRLGKTT